MQTISRYKFPIHLIAWSIFFLAPVLLSPGASLSNFFRTDVLLPMILRNIILVGFFYLNLYYLTPVTLKKQGIITFLLCIVTAIILISFVTDWMHMMYNRPMDGFGPGPGPGPEHFGPPPGMPRRPMPFGGPLITSFLVTIMIASVSSTIAFWDDWTKARELEKERALQKVASELAILKLQVSPHFLFNTLNNIRWLTRSDTARADEAIVKLSQMLRYILYQTSDDKVSLEKEVDNLSNLISLQKMRLVDATLVHFEVKGDIAGKTITPLLFVPLVENFFKHGDLEHEFRSKITLEVVENRLIFVTENKIRQQVYEVKEDSGIGVENVRRRLELHYPNRHLFSTSESEGIYKLRLEILL